MGTGRRDGTAATIVAAVGSAALAWLCGILVSDTAGWARLGWVAAGVVFTALAVGVPLTSQVRSARRAADATRLAAEARAELRLAINDALEPFANLMGQIAEARGKRQRQVLQARAVQLVLGAASGLVGGERVRACYFAYDPGPPRRLDPVPPAVGRAGQPSTTFVEGTARGDEVFSMLDADVQRFYPDLGEATPPGWPAGDKSYAAFIAVPVATPDRVFGMLTVDAPEPHGLTEDDVDIVRLLAELLAAALRS